MNLLRKIIKDYGLLLTITISSILLFIFLAYKTLLLPEEFFNSKKNTFILKMIVTLGVLSTISNLFKKIGYKRKCITFNAETEKYNYIEDVKCFKVYSFFLNMFYKNINSQVFSDYLIFKIYMTKKFNIIHEQKIKEDKKINYKLTIKNESRYKKSYSCNLIIEDTYIIKNILNSEKMTIKISRDLEEKTMERINSYKIKKLFQKVKILVIENKIKEINFYSTMSTYNRENFYYNFLNDRDIKKANITFTIYNINEHGTKVKKMKPLLIK